MSMILRRRIFKNTTLDSEERNDLKEKRKNKQTKFAWLARFFQSRPSAQQLSDQGILQQQAEPKPQVFFGVPVTRIYEDPSNLRENVPIPLYESAKALRQYLTIEGLFRVSGIFSEMNKMKDVFEARGEPNFDEVQSKHSISGLLEMWFRELPEPITTHQHYDDFMSCVSDEIPDDASVMNISKLVHGLPEENQVVLSFLLKLMQHIASHEEENKMGAKNLGVVFGSILLGGAVLCFSLGLKTTLERQNKVVQLMIEHQETILPDQSFALFADF